ncbi:putative methylase [Actinobacillus ureae]|nr:putative methylase [Actinobacillus ureae]
MVFVDPPFNHGFLPKVLKLLADNQWLADNALIYVETEKNHPPLELPNNWQIIKEKTAGQVISRLIQCL